MPSHYWMDVKILKFYKGEFKDELIKFNYVWKWYRKPGTQVFQNGQTVILTINDLPKDNKSVQSFGYCGRRSSWFEFDKDNEKTVIEALRKDK